MPENNNTEDTGARTFHDLCLRYGWVGTYFGRGDVECVIDRELTDAEWDTVRASGGGAVIQDAMVDAAWDALGMMVPALDLDGED